MLRNNKLQQGKLHCAFLGDYEVDLFHKLTVRCRQLQRT